MQCDRKAAQGGQEPSMQARTNKENDKQKNYLKKELARLRLLIFISHTNEKIKGD